MSDAKEVVCIRCNAQPGEPCTEHKAMIIGYHKERVDLRDRLPFLPEEIPTNLSPTDKAIIVYYAFVALANSVAANSEKILGKQFTSQEIQRTFGKKGLNDAKEDGMLGELSNGKQRRKAKKTRIYFA